MKRRNYFIRKNMQHEMMVFIVVLKNMAFWRFDRPKNMFLIKIQKKKKCFKRFIVDELSITGDVTERIFYNRKLFFLLFFTGFFSSHCV